MENLARLSYNTGMQKPLPDVDLTALCLDLEEALGYSPTVMAERLGVPIKTYQRWRSTEAKEQREPSGQPAFKLSLLVREVEAKTGKKFSFKLKEV